MKIRTFLGDLVWGSKRMADICKYWKTIFTSFCHKFAQWIDKWNDIHGRPEVRSTCIDYY